MRALVPILLFSLTACGDREPGPSLISLSPAVPTTSDDLVVTVDTEALDPEGDSVTYRYLWYKDDELQEDQTEATVLADATAKGQLWRVEVIATDGSGDGPPVAAEVAVVNTAPIVSITLSPDQPQSDDDIVATIDIEDPDGDVVTTDFYWTRDGVETSNTSTTIPASDTMRWQTWEIFVSSNDGQADGELAEAGVMVDNQPPTVSEVGIEPTEAYEGSILSAWATTSDLEGDVPVLHTAWYVDGSLVLEGDELTLDGTYFDKGQQVTVTITANDSYDDGGSMSSEAVEILNSGPSIKSVTIEPTELYEGDTATCTGDGLEDPDGDSVTSVYTWYVNGKTVSSDTTIDGAYFDRGDTVQCDITANDGQADGSFASSEVVTVLNTIPSIGSVTISPSSPAEGDTITSTLVDAMDADDDTITYVYAWYVDGSQVSSDTELGSDLFDKHQDIVLEVTPDDGIETGTTVSSTTATVLNTPPSITGVTLDPEEPSYRDTVTAIPEGWSDADGEAEAYLYSWYVGGTVVSTEDSLDLSTQDRGSEAYVLVTPYDEDDSGSSVSSDIFSIQASLTANDADLTFLGDGGDQVGMSLAVAGDITGDGISDIIVGAPASSASDTDAGAVYLVAGTTTGDVDYDAADVRLLGGEADDAAGTSVSWAGDVDGDGWDDLLVGVPGDATFGADAGMAYLVLGPVNSDQELGSAGIAILGQQAGETVGYDVAGGGDFDQDGFDDIVIGAYGVDGDAGAVYLGYGPITSVRYLDTMDVELTGEAGDDNAGWAVAIAGDVDGDGMHDVLVGAPSESSADTDAGAAYLLYGPVTNDLDLGSSDAILQGEAAWDYAGYAVSSAGDVDNDGLDDLLVGARYEDSGGSAAGAAYLVLSAVGGTTSLSTADAKLLGSEASETAGNAMAALGDIDADGFDDIAVAAEGRDSQGTNTGGVYVLAGPITGTFVMDDSYYSVIDATSSGDKAGHAVAGGADMDGDGIPDLLVGAPYEDSNGTSSGAASLFSGLGL